MTYFSTKMLEELRRRDAEISSSKTPEIQDLKDVDLLLRHIHVHVEGAEPAYARVGLGIYSSRRPKIVAAGSSSGKLTLNV